MRFASFALFCGIAFLPLLARADEKLAWNVKPANGGPSLLIIGSVAFLGVENYPLPDYVQSAYAQSGTLLFESNFGELDKPEFGEKINAAMLLPEGKTLASESSSTFRKALFDRCDELKIDAGGLKLQSLQPWGAALRIFFAANAKIGVEGRYAADRAIYTMAAVDGKPVMGLDSADRVLEMVTEWPIGSPKEEFGLQLMTEQTIVSQNLTELRAAWKRGDLTYLEPSLARSYAKFPNLRQRLITGRAKDWAERLAHGNPLPPKTLGVLPLVYLIGDDGLLAQLTAAGCQVQRVK